MSKYVICLILLVVSTNTSTLLYSQALKLPQGTNFPSSVGRTIGVTEINVKWNAPGVKGREGKIWGTDIAYYGTTVLGFGSNSLSPWRAGADESTTISFSTDVKINGQKLQAGKYGFFIELYPDSSILIFNRNAVGWGSYFYDSALEALRVVSKQQKDQKPSKERLEFTFKNQTKESVELALEWEFWRIPMTIEVDLIPLILADIQSQMTTGIGFDPSSLESAATWCLNNNINLDQALVWITSATDPRLGGLKSFVALSTRSAILKKMGHSEEANKYMDEAMNNASVTELHLYGRKLLGEKKVEEAMVIFERNFKQNKGVWPTNVGMMRGYSAIGNLKKAKEHAILALGQAPDDLNKKNLNAYIKQLEAGQPLD